MYFVNQWKKRASQSETMNKNTHGGKRIGSGKKPKNGVAKVSRSVSVLPEHESKIIAKYGGKNLSQAIEHIGRSIC